MAVAVAMVAVANKQANFNNTNNTNTQHMETPEVMDQKPKVQGAFVDSLQRNNKKIREDRARQIGDKAKLAYKRQIEDIQSRINEINWDREAMIDLSPTTAESLVVASDFKSADFVKKDLEVGLQLRDLQIQEQILIARYEFLFGDTSFSDAKKA